MSIVKYADKSYNIINDILNNDSYFNYSLCQNVDNKEYVVIEKIYKEKLRNELSKLPINDVGQTFEEYLNAYKKDIQLLKESVCQNLLQGIDFIDEEDQIIIVKEYADMNLLNYIKKEKGHGINPKEIKFIFNQLNKGLEIFKNSNSLVISYNSSSDTTKENTNNNKDYIDFGVNLFDNNNELQNYYEHFYT